MEAKPSFPARQMLVLGMSHASLAAVKLDFLAIELPHADIYSSLPDM